MTEIMFFNRDPLFGDYRIKCDATNAEGYCRLLELSEIEDCSVLNKDEQSITISFPYEVTLAWILETETRYAA